MPFFWRAIKAAPSRGRLGIEAGEITGDVKRVCRGEGGQRQKATPDQPVNRTKGKLCAGDFGNADGPGLDRLFRKPRFRAGQPGGDAMRHQRHDKPPVGCHWHRRGKLLLQLVMKIRPLRCQQ